ncbi:hypothetical protein BJV82DRAFT_669788 [Fennellomyces sp. T-0311]|nr:hypothetical protein BJV82DRAFT_669788 [Fennellomyces sp. T-0311]
MKNPVSFLPVEILSAIANQLSRQDHSSCCHVNRQWYAFFRRFLYKTISLKSRRRYDAFVRHMQHNTAVQWVRQVHFLEGVSTLESLRDVCPSIDMLHLELTGQGCIQIPMSLYHLTLDYSDQEDYYDQLLVNAYDATMPSIDRTLSCMPALRSLSLVGIFRALRVEHLSNIHLACPTLTDLALEVEFLCHPSPQQPEKRGLLRTLSIRTRTAIMTSEWACYVLHQYPHLERLNLGAPKPSSYDAVLGSNGILLNNIPGIRNSLIRFIPCLRSALARCGPHDYSASDLVTAVSAAPVDMFEIRLKFYNSQITQLNLYGDAQFPHSLNIDIVLTCLTSLTRLHATSVSLERGTRPVGHHPLQKLHLVKSWVTDSAFDSIIQRCPRLSQLALTDCSVLLLRKRFALRMPHHAMRSIVLKDVSLTDYLGAFDDPVALVQLHILNELPQWLVVKQALDYDSYISIQCRSLGQLIVN